MEVLPLTTRVGVPVLMAMHALYRAFPNFMRALCLVPGNTVNGMVWNLVTSFMVERSVVALGISCAVVALYGHLFESRWGLHEVLRFTIVCALASSVGSFVLIVAIYVATKSEAALFCELSGFCGVAAGVAVAIHQAAVSEAQGAAVPNWLVGESRKVAMLYLVIHAIWCFSTGRAIEVLPAICGLVSSWVYLRFYQPHPSTAVGTLGDASATFDFSSMFPASLQPAVARFSSSMWAVVQVAVPPSLANGGGDVERGMLVNETAQGHLPGSTPAIAEERRARAARSLDERLAAAARPT